MLALSGALSRLLGRGRSISKAMLSTSQMKGLVSSQSHGSQLVEMVKSCIPLMTHDLHKGSCGRVAVVGGCKEYTGAPYFSAISSLKVGADLSHVFCMEAAAPVIKSYSPELIVHPILDQESAPQELGTWMARMHSLVIGPGLGSDPALFSIIQHILRSARDLQLPLVIDADGIHFIGQEPALIKDCTRAILTPNAVEFNRLYETVLGSKPAGEDVVEWVRQLSGALGNVTVVRKGPSDIISDGREVLVCCSEGSPRRCGGQGDLLAGAMATFTHWAHQVVQGKPDNAMLRQYGPTMCAAYAGCLLTRECMRLAYATHRRSTVTTDMIAVIQEASELLFCAESKL